MNISKKIEKNLEHIKNIMSIPLCTDAILREFVISYNNTPIKAFLIYYEGIASSTRIDEFILQSLHLLEPHVDEPLEKLVANQLLSANQLSVVTTFEDVMSKVNYGCCAVFVDGVNASYVSDVKGWERRGISEPVTENVIRGSQEAFIETIRINTGLVRRLVRNENLICEAFSIGTISHTPCNLLYIKGTTDEKIILELRRRINAINTEYIMDSGELEQVIEDFSFLPSPQIISTERPDRVASALMDGKAVIMLDGSPFALIMPVNAFDLLHTPEDKALRFPYANLVRIIRVTALIISLLFPSILVAVSNFHQEVIPVHLLFAISASRRSVPFSLITELILFEIAFEIIREASIRIPSTAGNAMGIIGGLIIGQAAIDASIVSPIVIITVALTGMGSFAIPNYSLTFTYRILKYVYILLAAIAGILGITFGIFIHLALLCNSQSLGVPFMAPFSEYSKNTYGKIFVKSIWHRYGFKNPRKWATNTNSTKTSTKSIKIR